MTIPAVSLLTSCTNWFGGTWPTDAVLHLTLLLKTIHDHVGMSPDTRGLTKPDHHTRAKHSNILVNSSSYDPPPQNCNNSSPTTPYQSVTPFLLLGVNLGARLQIGLCQVGACQLLGSHQLNLSCVILLQEVITDYLSRSRSPNTTGWTYWVRVNDFR